MKRKKTRNRVVFIILLFFSSFPVFAAEPAPGDACTQAGDFTRSGGPEVAGGGHFLYCNGSNWVSVFDYTGSGKIFTQIGNDTGDCTGQKTGRLRYNEGTDTWEYCNGSAWVPFEHAASAADTTPDAFTFTDLTDVPGSTLIESDIVQITGIDSIAPVSISGDGSPEYRICADATCTSSTGWFSFNSGIVNNQYLQLQLTSSGSYSTTLSAIIDIGDIADQWDVTTEAAPDNTPDAFSFTDQTDVSVSTQIQSNIVQITGISNGTNISIAGDGSPQYRICADGTCSTAPAYTGSAGTIDAGEYVQLRLTSSASNAATLSATLTIGTGSDQWDVTTEAAAPSGPAGCPNIADQCDDNSIYIGEHPTEAGVKLYATDVNQSTAIDWSTAEYGIEIESQGYPNSWVNGQTNQQWIVNNKTLSDYPAFELCENLDRHGYQDWYLPALAELDLMYSNLVLSPPGDDPDNPTDPNSGGGGGSNPTARDGAWAGTFTTSYYWSSSEYSADYAWIEAFNDGNQGYDRKYHTYNDVRCVRR